MFCQAGPRRLTAPGVKCSSMVRAFADGAMGRRIDPSWGGPIEVFLVPARLWYVLSCLLDGAYKRTLAVNREKVAHVAVAGLFSRYLNGPLPYV